MEPLSFQGRWSLVTGASSGLGRELAREIALKHKGNVVVVARRRERLEELKAELEPSGVKVVCVTADLSKPEDVARVFAESTADGRVIHAALLNAGVTFFGHHLEMPEAEQQALIATNLLSVVRLANDFLKHQLAASPGGGVMVVSSLTGNSPTTYQALYSGTKAFLNMWGVALAQELVGTPVSLTVAACGGIATEMGDKSGTGRKYKKGDVGVMDADVCARACLAAFQARRKYSIPGVVNRVSDAFMRLVSRSGQAKIMSNVFKGALLPKGHA